MANFISSFFIFYFFSIDSQPFPVLVILHGESYDWHSGNVFDGSILASYGQVIVVTVNFRLGILGFLPAFTDGTIRGNYGLMDQVAALHWIQENIGEFGGQPSNVTLIGHGHGGAFAHLLMLSPMAKGLFNRVILMSGSALSPWAIARDPEHYARELGRKLNCTDLDTMIDCLRTKKISHLIAQYENISPEYLTAFGPIIDSIVVPFDPVHIYHYHQHHNDQLYHSSSPSSSSSSSSLERATNSNKERTHFDPLALARSYDLMIGVTDVDSPCLFSDHESIYGVEPDRRDRILRTLVRNLYDYHQQAIFLILYNEYSSWNAATTPISYSSSSSSTLSNLKTTKRSFDILDSAKSILSDALVFAPLVRTADLHSNESWSSTSSSQKSPFGGRLFFYYFDTNQVSQESLFNENRISSTSSSSSPFSQSTDQLHLSSSKRIVCSIGHDLAFLFGDPIAQLQFGLNNQVGPFYYPVNLTQTHQIVSELFIQYIVNFARYGEPNTRPSHFTMTSSSSSSSRQQSKIKTALTHRHFWPRYDLEQKNYLLFGSTGPKPMDHRQNHRLSLWLNLIPRLLIDDQDFYQTNFGANLTNNNESFDPNNPRNNIMRTSYKLPSRFSYYSRNFPNHYYRPNNSYPGNDRVISETSKHVAGSMAMASEPYSSQQQQHEKQLYRQHHLLVDYDNPKSYDGIVRSFSNDTNTLNKNNNNNTDSLKSNNSHNSSILENHSAVTANLSSTSSINHNWYNVTHHPINSTEMHGSDGNRLLHTRYDDSGMGIGHPMYYGPVPDGSVSWWLIMIGTACAILFFINVIFFIALFYQLKKNRKVQKNPKSNNENKNVEINNIQSKCNLSGDQSPNLSTMFGNKCGNEYRESTRADQNLDDNLMILHTTSNNNNTFNRKKSNNMNDFSYSMYPTPGDHRQPISFELTPSDITTATTTTSTNTIGKRTKTLSFAHQGPVTSGLNDHHTTILLNHNSDNIDGATVATGNYVPFLTATNTNPTTLSSTHPQQATYYCLQVNATNHSNSGNDGSDYGDQMIDDGTTNTIEMQSQQPSSTSNTGYHEMSL
ncbi:postsynaptic membrane assembly [Dermatophagoides pteronyssinus]|uniref:Postsynaptic membrane assembly n=1 Tax=Dermatophagoides pteronyssinus TaxID=6956 RepID=A0ABQ8IZH8_DERPT|nr:postsynaptic membrane assembly [Dermatophagoides pteronyssinus]